MPSSRSTPLPLIHNRAGLARLTAAVRNQQLAAFVGAGLSQGLGYPGWNQLITHLASLRTHGGASMSAYDALLRADLLRRQLGTHYGAAMKRIFGDGQHQDRLEASGVYRALAQAPFRFYATTNYDRAIERAAAHFAQEKLATVDWTDRDVLNDFLLRTDREEGPRACFHVHGVFHRPQTLVLTESDYRERYYKSRDHRQRLLSMLFRHRFLFLGFSLQDQDINALLREQIATFDVWRPRHFAVLDFDPKTTTRERLEARTLELKLRYSIEPVFYRLGRGKNPYARLEQIVKQITGAGARDQDPDDPQLGKWGGQRRNNGYVLDATVKPSSDRDWFDIVLTVRRERGKPVEKGEVEFFLHPTFDPDRRRVALRAGVAKLEVSAWGAFTVGARVTRTSGSDAALELNLRDVKGAPTTFRAR